MLLVNKNRSDATILSVRPLQSFQSLKSFYRFASELISPLLSLLENGLHVLNSFFHIPKRRNVFGYLTVWIYEKLGEIPWDQS